MAAGENTSEIRKADSRTRTSRTRAFTLSDGSETRIVSRAAIAPQPWIFGCTCATCCEIIAALRSPGVFVNRRIQCYLLAWLLWSITLLAVPAAAESSFTTPGPSDLVRYHYGDNPAWANPGFDDSSWPAAVVGEFPTPAFQSDGFFWIRTNVAVPNDATGALGLRAALSDTAIDVYEISVNGVRIGQYGRFPPHAAPLIQPQAVVFDIPASVATPGSRVVVALRGWTLSA